MGFLDEFEGDGEFADETIIDALYIQTQDSSTDFAARVSDAKLHTNHEEHDTAPGEEQLIVELEVLQVTEGMCRKKGSAEPRELEVDDLISLHFPMYENVKKSYKKNLYKELVNGLSAMAGKRESEVRKDTRSFVKDAAKGKFDDNTVRVVSKPPNDSGYENLELMPFDEDNLD